jgi:hypothetical protein
MDYFSTLPAERIVDIALTLPVRSIRRLCQSSKRFNDIICDNDNFWRHKLMRDYNFIPENYEGSMKYLYSVYGYLWLVGVSLHEGGTIFNPLLIPDIVPVSVATGYSHVLILDINANVWVFGNNFYRQILPKSNDVYIYF